VNHRVQRPRRGRPRDTLYDEAYQKVKQGVPYEQAYEEWLQQNNWQHDLHARDNFHRAMRRREKNDHGREVQA
jgi:hypothetical protein